MKVYAVKFVTFIHYIMGFTTIKCNNGTCVVFGPPKFFSVFLVAYITFMNCYLFIPNIYRTFLRKGELSAIISSTHTCTLLLNASISLAMQIIIPFERKLKIYKNLKYLKTNVIYEEEKKIVEFVKTLYFLYLLSYILHTFYILINYRGFRVLLPMFFSNLILDAFLVKFVIDVLLINTALKIINTKLLNLTKSKIANVNFERTSVLISDFKEDETESKYSEIDEIISLLKAYEKLKENVVLISQNISFTVKI